MAWMRKVFPNEGCCSVCGSREYEEYIISCHKKVAAECGGEYHCSNCSVVFHNPKLWGQVGKAKVELVKRPESSSESLSDPMRDDRDSIYHRR